MDQLEVPIFIGIALLITGGFLFWQKKRVEQIAEEFANDPDVEVPKGWVLRMNTRPPHPPGHVVQAGGGKNNPPRWDIISEARRTSSRTSVSVSREGFSGSLRELLGIKDVHIGDETFDKRFTLRGSDADAVRGIVSNPAVMQAIYDLFDSPAIVWSFEVKKNGQVLARAARSGSLNAGQAKELLLATSRLATALEQHADAPSAAAPSRVA